MIIIPVVTMINSSLVNPFPESSFPFSTFLSLRGFNDAMMYTRTQQKYNDSISPYSISITEEL